MISIELWRARIGRFNCSRQSRSISLSSNLQQQTTHGLFSSPTAGGGGLFSLCRSLLIRRALTLMLVAVITHLLLSAGDVERNPGPIYRDAEPVLKDLQYMLYTSEDGNGSTVSFRLMDRIRPQVTGLAIALGFPRHVIALLKNDSDSVRFLLTEWLRGGNQVHDSRPLTWGTLITALREADLQEEVRILEEHFVAAHPPVAVGAVSLSRKRRHPGEYEGSDPAVAEGIVMRGKRQHSGEYQDTDPAVTESRAVSQTNFEEHTEAVDKLLKFWTSTQSVDLPVSAGLLTWMQLRDRSVSELRKLADYIDKCHKNVKIAIATSSGVGSVAGAFILCCTLFAPVTFGLSYAGTAAFAGAAAGFTILGASLTEMGVTKITCSTAQDYINADGKLTAILFFLLNKCNEHNVSAQRLADSWSHLKFARTVFGSITLGSSSTPLTRGSAMMNPGSRSLAKVTKISKVVITSAGRARRVRRTVSELIIFAERNQSLASEATHAFGAFGGVFAGVGLVFDVYTFITTSIDLANGSVSAAGAALRKNADLLEKQQIEITDLIKKLQEKD